jgi:hypothetical protein
MSLKTLWDGNDIDFADCIDTVGDKGNLNDGDWCSEFRCEVQKLIAQGYNVFSSKYNRYVSNFCDCGSVNQHEHLEIFFVCLNKGILNENTAGFIDHVETSFDDYVYTLRIPAYYFMTKAAAKRVANCLHWLEAHNMYMLPLTIAATEMAKRLKPENEYDTKRVEDARLKHEERMKRFDLVFWWEQYMDWKDVYDEEYPKLEAKVEQYRQEHYTALNARLRFPEEVKIYNQMKQELDEMWDTTRMFRHILDIFKSAEEQNIPAAKALMNDCVKRHYWW